MACYIQVSIAIKMMLTLINIVKWQKENAHLLNLSENKIKEKWQKIEFSEWFSDIHLMCMRFICLITCQYSKNRTFHLENKDVLSDPPNILDFEQYSCIIWKKWHIHYLESGTLGSNFLEIGSLLEQSKYY